MPVPVFKTQVDEDTHAAAREVLESGWLGMGGYVQAFEEQLARFLQVAPERSVVAVNTGTSALHLALLAAGVGDGDEVITPAMNNIGDFQAIGACGASPAFCDVHEDGQISVASAGRMVGPRVKAILPLHYMGVPCDLDGVYAIADAHGLRVVEDCCHAVGTSGIGERDLACFSFDPIKTMTCIDGGAIVANEEEVDALRRARHLGVTANDYVEVGRSLSRPNGGYDVLEQGFRYHLANLHAAIGLSQLRSLQRWIENRRSYAEAYSAALRDLPGIVTPAVPDGVSLFGYVVRVLDGERDALRRHLAGLGVDSGVHWRPGHWLTEWRTCRGANALPVSERIATEIVTLPLWSLMEPPELDQVIDAIWSFYE